MKMMSLSLFLRRCAIYLNDIYWPFSWSSLRITPISAETAQNSCRGLQRAGTAEPPPTVSAQHRWSPHNPQLTHCSVKLIGHEAQVIQSHLRLTLRCLARQKIFLLAWLISLGPSCVLNWRGNTRFIHKQRAIHIGGIQDWQLAGLLWNHTCV